MLSSERLRADLRERHEIIGCCDIETQVAAVRDAMVAIERVIAYSEIGSWAFPVFTVLLGILIGGINKDAQLLADCALRVRALAQALDEEEEAGHDQN